jgi:foldase protein PrsA
MSIRRPFHLLVLLGALAVLAAGCGGSSSSGAPETDLENGAVAMVGNTAVTKTQLEQFMSVAKSQYKSLNRPFPPTGSPEYKQIQDKALELLVQQAEFTEKGKQLGIVVTDKQVDQRFEQLIKDPPPNGFGGDKKRFQSQLKAQGFTEQDIRDQLRGRLLSVAITNSLTKDVSSAVNVSDAEVKTYYDLHAQDYSTPQTRVVRHILVKSKSEADKLYQQLKNGADFAALAKKFSQDPGTKAIGGELTITRGGTVKPFDSAAFALRTGELSKPVQSTYGWHIIQAVKPAKPRQVTPFAKAKSDIRQLLLQQKRAKIEEKRAKAVKDWLAGVTKEFCSGKLEYAKGYKPATDPCAQSS